jgi:hypothetical protein
MCVPHFLKFFCCGVSLLLLLPFLFQEIRSDG